MNEALLQQLHDVYEPTAIGWWPLAWGWWIVLAIALCLLIFLTYWVNRRLRANRYRKEAAQELERVFAQWEKEFDTPCFLQASHQLVRRICLKVASKQNAETQIASLTGTRWKQFLEGFMVDCVSGSTIDALVEGSYRKTLEGIEPHHIYTELKRWIRKHPSEVPHV